MHQLGLHNPLSSLISVLSLNQSVVYADDTQLFVSPQPDLLNVNISLHEVCNASWMTSNLLCFNGTKTECLLLVAITVEQIHYPALTLNNGIPDRFLAQLTFVNLVSSSIQTSPFLIRSLQSPVHVFTTSQSSLILTCTVSKGTGVVCFSFFFWLYVC